MIHTKVYAKTPDAQSQLNEIRTELDAFLYRASHDLKGPLARMEGLVELMKSSNPGVELQFSLKLIEALTGEMNGVINNIIHVQDLFKAEPTFHTHDPRLLVNEVVAQLKAESNHPGIELNIDINTKDTWYTDHTLVRIILRELLKNAFTFFRKGESQVVSLSLFHEGDRIIMEIRDQGTGILPQHLDRIFDPFFKGSEDSNGSGLGLFMVKKAVFQLNGSMEVHSEPNHGSHFRISLPKN